MISQSVGKILGEKMSVLNATEYETIMNEAYVNAGMDPIYDDPSKAGVGTNWQNEIYNENAPIMNHQASISGGGDKGSYFLSFGYLDQEGIVGGKDKSDYKRYSLRFNNTYNVFENKANKFFRSFKGRYEPRIYTDHIQRYFGE